MGICRHAVVMNTRRSASDVRSLSKNSCRGATPTMRVVAQVVQSKPESSCWRTYGCMPGRFDAR